MKFSGKATSSAQESTLSNWLSFLKFVFILPYLALGLSCSMWNLYNSGVSTLSCSSHPVRDQTQLPSTPSPHPHHPHWTQGILASGPPRKSFQIDFLSFENVFICLFLVALVFTAVPGFSLVVESKKHKLESRLLGEISITSDMQMTPPLWQTVKRN